MSTFKCLAATKPAIFTENENQVELEVKLVKCLISSLFIGFSAVFYKNATYFTVIYETIQFICTNM